MEEWKKGVTSQKTKLGNRKCDEGKKTKKRRRDTKV
jgi:hypothetical protein